TATVTATDPASLGTLFDLSSYCIDVLRSSNVPTPPAIPTPSPFPSLGSSAPTALRAACTETLEVSLLLSATQLGLHAKASGGANARTLNELGSDLAELLDKAAGLSSQAGRDGDGDRNRKALLQVVKAKVVQWV
ncbi:hypothetical protein JCM11251_006180, partial [Rhodosporidiobolus azoricus]